MSTPLEALLVHRGARLAPLPTGSTPQRAPVEGAIEKNTCPGMPRGAPATGVSGGRYV
jgi:hypothetical protein